MRFTAGILVNFEQFTIQLLDKIAEEQHVTRSALVRRYINEGIEREKAQNG